MPPMYSQDERKIIMRARERGPIRANGKDAYEKALLYNFTDNNLTISQMK
jgi:hypothetical protein